MAIVFLLSFISNASVFGYGFHDYDTVDLIALSMVIVDLFVIIALFLKPTNKLNKLTPFYAEETIITSSNV